MSTWSRRRELLSAMPGTLSAINRNAVRDQSESLSAIAGIRILSEDAVRRALAAIEEERGTAWLRRLLDHRTAP